jgi:hypothetical protein
MSISSSELLFSTPTTTYGSIRDHPLSCVGVKNIKRKLSKQTILRLLEDDDDDALFVTPSYSRGRDEDDDDTPSKRRRTKQKNTDAIFRPASTSLSIPGASSYSPSSYLSSASPPPLLPKAVSFYQYTEVFSREISPEELSLLAFPSLTLTPSSSSSSSIFSSSPSTKNQPALLLSPRRRKLTRGGSNLAPRCAFNSCFPAAAAAAAADADADAATTMEGKRLFIDDDEDQETEQDINDFGNENENETTLSSPDLVEDDDDESSVPSCLLMVEEVDDSQHQLHYESIFQTKASSSFLSSLARKSSTTHPTPTPTPTPTATTHHRHNSLSNIEDILSLLPSSLFAGSVSLSSSATASARTTRYTATNHHRRMRSMVY